MHNWQLLGRFAFHQYDFKGYYIYPGDTRDSTWFDVDYGSGKWLTAELKLSRALPLGQKLTAGMEFRDNLQQDQQSYGFVDFRDSRVGAFYGEDEITSCRYVVLNLGARYDQYDTFGGTLNPRAAVILKPSRKTAIKLLYGTAFRAPNAYENYYAAGPYIANPMVLPEKGRTYEIVWEQRLGKRFQLNTSAYTTDINKLLAETVDPAASRSLFANNSSIMSHGVEAELLAKLPRGWESRSSLNLQRTWDEQTEQDVPNSPRNLAKLNLRGPVWNNRLFVGVEGRYTGARRTLAGNRLGAFPVANLTVRSKRLAGRFDASFSIYNLADHRFANPATEEHPEDSITQDGRSFRFKLSYHFGAEK